MKGERYPTLSQLLQSAIRTIDEVLMPELQTQWAKSSAMGLVGQLRYALARGGARLSRRSGCRAGGLPRGFAR